MSFKLNAVVTYPEFPLGLRHLFFQLLGMLADESPPGRSPQGLPLPEASALPKSYLMSGQGKSTKVHPLTSFGCLWRIVPAPELPIDWPRPSLQLYGSRTSFQVCFLRLHTSLVPASISSPSSLRIQTSESVFQGAWSNTFFNFMICRGEIYWPPL